MGGIVTVRHRLRAGSRAFELLALSLVALIPLVLGVAALLVVPIGLFTVAAWRLESILAWAQQYRRVIRVPAPPIRPVADAGSTEWARWTGLLRDPRTWRDVGWAVAAPGSGLALLGVPLLLGTYGVVLFCSGVWEAVSGRHLTIAVLHLPPWVAGPAGIALWIVAVLVLPLGLRAQTRLAGAVLGPTAAERVRKLTADRAELIDTRAAELRRIERDLHDGAQTRLVSMGIMLRTAERVLDTDPDQARHLLAEARGTASDALTELRTLVHGIHPPVLAERGLGDAVRALALRCPVPSEVTVELPRPVPDAVAAAVYFSVSELLANVAKHAAARLVRIELTQPQARLLVRVVDDGRGGADPAAGTGLSGVRRRLAAFDATMAVDSPPGGPTAVTLEVPCGSS